VDGNAVVLEFDVERTPLAAKGGGALQGFALAGSDGVFHWATATAASPTTVRVTCDKVQAPVEVRYGWQDNPQNANLVDNAGQEGLPAHPFRRIVSN
jgi:sialate O-acetylesterase